MPIVLVTRPIRPGSWSELRHVVAGIGLTLGAVALVAWRRAA
ncbi:MAG TPA: hypothetical protein VED01_18860 [Burkholderiales bacterium]|nr:hypothetical protein [Burkholderiales bacterium]